MASSSTSLTAKLAFNQRVPLVSKPDNIEYALTLIDLHERPFPQEISELQTGLELVGEILADMRTIHDFN